jgi:hypothetical protein
MNLANIRKHVARNISQLSDDGYTIIDGVVNKLDIDDEINRIYLESIAHELISKNPDDFTTETKTNTYRQSFSVTSIDLVNKLINSNIGVFGLADIGTRIQNPTTNEFYTIDNVISSQQILVKETPQSSLVGATCYILSNIILLDGAENLKEVTKFEIRQNNYTTYTKARLETVNNYKDKSNVYTNFFSEPIYSVGTIEVGDTMQRCIFYYPYPITYDGEIRISYIKLPKRLSQDTDEPSMSITGISDTIILGVTSWACLTKGETDKYQLYEEKFRLSLQNTLNNYRPRRTEPVRYAGFRNRR